MQYKSAKNQVREDRKTQGEFIMPNIDTSTIEGFDAMSAEDQVKALLGLDIPEKVDLSGYVKKELLDKTASDLAAAKRSLKEKMTSEEAAKAQSDEAMKELQDKYNELLKKTSIAENTAKYLEVGYSPELAKSTAEAIFNGDMDAVLENQKKYNAECEKRFKENVERGLHPNGGSNTEKDSPEIALAKQLGKRTAEANQVNKNALEHYLKF
jgi:flagellar hook-length control protein FliK